MLSYNPQVCQIRAPDSQARVTRRIWWASFSFYARKGTKFYQFRWCISFESSWNGLQSDVSFFSKL